MEMILSTLLGSVVAWSITIWVFSRKMKKDGRVISANVLDAPVKVPKKEYPRSSNAWRVITALQGGYFVQFKKPEEDWGYYDSRYYPNRLPIHQASCHKNLKQAKEIIHKQIAFDKHVENFSSKVVFEYPAKKKKEIWGDINVPSATSGHMQLLMPAGPYIDSAKTKKKDNMFGDIPSGPRVD